MLQEYKPLIRQLFSKDLFGPLDQRYFRLIDRSSDVKDEVREFKSVRRKGYY